MQQMVCKSLREKKLHIFCRRVQKASVHSCEGRDGKAFDCWVHVRIGLWSFVAWPCSSLLSPPGNTWVVMLAVLIVGGPFNVWPLHERNVCLSLYLVGIARREDGSEREHCTCFWLIQDLVLCSLRVMLLGGEPRLCGMP